MTDLILYTTEDGMSQIKLHTENQTVWLTQLEMAERFDATKQNISLPLKNLFQNGELDEAAVVKESLTTQMQPGHEATVKQSLTVRAGFSRSAVTEESSVAQKEQP
jgi:hypothetical protein